MDTADCVLDAVDTSRPAALTEGVEVVSVRSGPLYSAADEFLYDIYRTAGFCAPSPRRVVEELTPWTSAATYHIAANGSVLGTVRTIVGELDALPVGAFELDGGLERARVCELSSLAVSESLRGGGVVEHLYRAGWCAAFRSGASWLAGLVDPWLLDVFVDHYRLPFAQVGKAKFHMGAEVLPVGMPLQGPAYEDLATARPGFWDWTLEAVTAAEATAWSLPDPRGVTERLDLRSATLR